VNRDLRAAVLRDRVLTAVSRTEEVREMQDLRATGQEASRDLLNRMVKTLRTAAGMLTALRVLTGALAVMTGLAEALKGREISSETAEIPSRARASLRRQAERIWKRSVRKTRDASVRRRISAPRKTISMRKKKA
jgi:hypothetical protein